MKLSYLKTKTAVLWWNLDEIERDIERSRFVVELKRMLVVNLVGLYTLEDVDWTKVDVSIPPIVASLGADKYCVLSGGEQIEKARLLGFKTLRCFFLKPSQHKRYIIDYDEEIYRRAVSEYWEEDEDDWK